MPEGSLRSPFSGGAVRTRATPHGITVGFIFQQSKDLKTAIVNRLEQNALMISQRVTADLDAQYGLNLSERKASEGENSFAGEYAPENRAWISGAGPIGTVGSLGGQSLGFSPADSNEDDRVTSAPSQ
ncbi:unnamed protein product [Agarophyton chilense]